MMTKRLVVGACLFVTASALVCYSPEEQVEVGNEITSCLRRELQANEPYDLLNARKGLFAFSNGLLYNAHTFQNRIAPQIGCVGSNVAIELLLSFNATKVHYTWKTLGLPFKGGYWTYVRQVTVAISLSSPLHGRVPVTFNGLRLTEYFAPSVRLDGVQPFSWLASEIGTFIAKSSSTTLKHFMEKNYRRVFGSAFKNCFVRSL